MTIKHHLNEKLLMSYAAGILPEAFNLVVATQMSISDEARARLASYEAIGGGILEETEKVEMSPNSLQDVFNKIKSAKTKKLNAPILKTDSDASARLLYIPAGTAMPNHSHNGLEMTLVLKGSFHDEKDLFKRGDIEIGDQDLHHNPTASNDGPCICLVASDASLRFKSIIPRLLQPFFKI
jgi:putative transcriptional regulator